ncbi:MAG: LIC_10190 family membrane protein [Chloroflexota bacterium]
MITVLVFALVFFPLGWLYGAAFLRLAARILRIEAQETSATVILLAGMIAMTTLAAGLSLALPLDWRAFSILILGAAAIFLSGSRQGWLKLSRPRLPRLTGWDAAAGAVLLLALLTVLENATHQVANPDTGIYHAQAIRWMEEYPTVAGLGNLHSRFAYNSHWLVLNAVFSLAFWGGRSLHLVGAMLFGLAVWDFGNGLRRWLGGERTAANGLRLLFLPLAFYLLGSQTSSPGTDLPVIMMLWLVIPLWLEQSALQKEQHDIRSLLIFSTAVYLLTVKLSALPLLLLAAWLVLSDVRHQPVRVLRWGFLGLLLLLPWLARNVILSGYLIYPFPALDWFNVDWKIPYETALREAQIIRAWARLPNVDASLVLKMSLGEWLPVWFSDRTTNQRLILLLAMLSPAGMGGVWLLARLKKWNSFGQDFGWMGAYLFAMAGALYWLFNAPDLRFGYGWVILLMTLPLAGLMSGLAGGLRDSQAFLVNAFLTVGMVVVHLWFLTASFEGRTFPQRWLLPPDYPLHATFPCPLENGMVLCAGEESYTQCYYQPFPCIPKPIEGVEMRGTDWGDGFRSVSGR